MLRNLLYTFILAVVATVLSSTLQIASCGEEKESAKGKSLRIYELGKWREVSLSELEQAERERRSGGHQPWREDVLLSARAFSLNLCGIKGSLKDSEWETTQTKQTIRMTQKASKKTFIYLLEKKEANAAVVLLTTPTQHYRLHLQRPVQTDWYITTVESLKRARSQ